MNREIGFVLEQGDLELFGKQSFWKGLSLLRHRCSLKFVARRFDNLQIKNQFCECLAALLQNHIGLSESQGTTPGGDGDYGLTHYVLEPFELSGSGSHRMQIDFPFRKPGPSRLFSVSRAYLGSCP